jgi:alpha-galactosidase
VARSPLMFGGNLPDNDDWTLGLITNGEVLAVDQKAVASREVFNRDNQVAWVASMPDTSAKYLAVFNTGDAEAEVKVNWDELGLAGQCALRDLWAKKDLGNAASGVFKLAPHASGFYRVTAGR